MLMFLWNKIFLKKYANFEVSSAWSVIQNIELRVRNYLQI